MNRNVRFGDKREKESEVEVGGLSRSPTIPLSWRIRAGEEAQ
jgi:hypothetical protein